MKNSFDKHLAAINSGRITRHNIIGIRKAFNAFEKSRHYGGSWKAPTMTADQYSAAERAIERRQPVAVGELHEGGLKVLRNPRYAKRWNERQRAIINAPDLRFELVAFDWLNAAHCVPLWRAVSPKLGQSFTYRNIPWQTAWAMHLEDGPRLVEYAQMRCPPFCDTCGGNLGRGGTDRDCEKCLRALPKKRIRADEFDPYNYSHFALRGGGGRGWRYYKKVKA